MKVYLKYEEMKKHIFKKIPLLESKHCDEVVAVTRGGVSIAHYF